MKKFGQYLKELIDNSDKNEAQVAAHLNIKSRSYLTEVEKGRALPLTIERCEQIADYLSLSKEKRENLMYLAVLERSPEEFRPYVEKALNLKGQGYAVSNQMKDYTQVPLLGECPASSKRWVADEVEQMHYLPKEAARGRRLYILRAAGDSMDRSGISNGDMVLVDADAQPQNGDVVVVRVDDECTMKRYYREGSNVTLMPDSSNSKHRPAFFDTKRSEVILRGVVESIFMKKLTK